MTQTTQKIDRESWRVLKQLLVHEKNLIKNFLEVKGNSSKSELLFDEIRVNRREINKIEKLLSL